MPRKPWAKLDFDFFEDKKVLELQSRLGVRGAYDWVKLVALWADPDFRDARIELSDNGTALKLQAKLGKSPSALAKYLDVLADVGLIDRQLWQAERVVTCNRAAEDAMARQNRRDGGAVGGSRKKRGNGP